MTKFNTSCQNPYARTAANESEALPWDDIPYIPPCEMEHIPMSQAEEESLQQVDICDMPNECELDGLGHFVETPDGGYWEYPHLRHF